MVKLCGFDSLDAMITATVPASIVRKDGMDLGPYHEGLTESEFLKMFK
jgi:glycine dehydrogenase